MKQTRQFLLVAPLALMLGAPLAAQPPTATPKSQNATYNSIQKSIREKKFSEAIAQVEEVLRLENLSAADKSRFLNAAADASLRQTPPEYSRAQQFYEKIVADTTIANTDKIAAINGLSDIYIASLNGQYLDRMNLAPAFAILDRALKLPALTPNDQALAFQNIGKLYERQDRFSEAIEWYQKSEKLDADEATKKSAWQLIAGVHATQNDVEKTIALSRQHNLDFVPLYKRLIDYTLTPAFARSADFDKAEAEMFKILDDPQVDDKTRWTVFTSLERWRWTRNNGVPYPALRRQLKQIKQASEKYLPAFMQVDPNRATSLLRVFKSDATPVFRDHFYYKDLVDLEFLTWAAPIILQAPRLSIADYSIVRKKYTNALLAGGNTQKAQVELASIATDERVDSATKFWARLVSSTLTEKNADVRESAQQEKALPIKEKAELLIDAAKSTLATGDEIGANKLYAAYESLVPARPTATITCSFSPDAPFDVGSWLASPLQKSAQGIAKLDRPYGDNLKQLVETDAAIEGRDAGTPTGTDTGDTETNFHIACDAAGVRIFFDAKDAQAAQVMEGLARGGSFEMYIAPGQQQPYYTFLPRLPGGPISTEVGMFNTMYPNSGHRLPSTADGTLQSSIQSTPDGFGVSIFLSWELFYDKLPSNGTRWQFESIRWTRSGGRSFGGSQSVHNRSSWGDIVFNNMTPQNLASIKRAIIFKAVTKYRDAQRILNPVGRWNDAELGDPVFYASRVAPLLARLDAHAAKVNKDMTAQEVETLFAEAVPGWMEINHHVAALRAEYLEEKSFAR